jgi:hypothetical protein
VSEIFKWLWSNPTRATGVASYGIALACCIFAWSRAKGDAARSRLAALLAVCEGCLLIDMVFNVRWILHQLFMDEATRLAVYASRRGPQAVALVVLVGIFLFGLRVVSQRLRGRGGALLAVSGALLSVALWCTEVVSLHQVDHILYHSIGSLMTVSFFWVVACTMTSVGVLVESKTARKDARVYPA